VLKVSIDKLCSPAVIVLLLFVPALITAQTAGDSDLNDGYKHLKAKDYDEAVASFRKGLALQPANAKVHKDLAYTLLKTGDNAEARDEFEQAYRAELASRMQRDWLALVDQSRATKVRTCAALRGERLHHRASRL
jgi:tetratricopeptide (TPR) repeat protein